MSRHLFISGILLINFFPAPYAQLIEKVKEINTAPNGSAYPHNLTTANNKLFFIAGDNINYNKLWITEGDSATTHMLGPATGALNSIANLVSYKGKVYFSYNDEINGLELWVSDGTAAGTVIFKDLYPGITGSFPQSFTVANNKLFFMAGSVDGERRLYVSDGTVAGTVVIKNNYIDLFNGMTTFAILNNNIYFRSDNGTGAGYGLWKSDGTLAGTLLVKPDITPGTAGGNYAVLNNKLYFSAFDYLNGSELWVSDGTEPGTHMVKNLKADGVGILGSGSPENLTVYNSKIYFEASDDAHGDELFVTDGTAAGTQLVKDMLPGTNSSVPYQITVYNGYLYIICIITQELWKSDGTEAGTELVKVILPDSKFAAIWDGKMYIINSYDNSVWESDGTAAGTGPVKVQNTLNPVASYGGDYFFTEYNAELFFSGQCYLITGAYELCKLTLGAAAVKAFSFTGTGNWSNPANWSGGKLPPANLPSGYSITINGQCILDIAQHIQSGATLTVAAGKSLLILGSLNIL
ncbi:MAG: ELWxxDGT repeat protein [Ferruginibacter sp.]